MAERPAKPVGVPPGPEDWDARRARLEASRQEMSRAYDRTLITLSSGALSLSLLFYRELAPVPTGGSRWFLLAAWICFAVSLIAIVSGFFVSERAHAKDLDKIDEAVGQQGFVAGGYLEKTSVALNAGSGLAFAVGVVMMLVFGAMNLHPEGGEMAKEETVTTKGGTAVTTQGKADVIHALPVRPTKRPSAPAQPPSASAERPSASEEQPGTPVQPPKKD